MHAFKHTALPARPCCQPGASGHPRAPPIPGVFNIPVSFSGPPGRRGRGFQAPRAVREVAACIWAAPWPTAHAPAAGSLKLCVRISISAYTGYLQYMCMHVHVRACVCMYVCTVYINQTGLGQPWRPIGLALHVPIAPSIERISPAVPELAANYRPRRATPDPNCTGAARNFIMVWLAYLLIIKR